MEILIIASQLILSLSILVVLHEFGHYIPAKLFKIRVEKFYLFFDPWFSIFKRKIGETEWGIGWLPLGGYVKISGMVDESMDKDQLAQEPKPWEFRSKPAWQRLIVMIGGVTVNFILALIIYAMILFTWGKQYFNVESAEQYGLAVAYPELKQYGLQDGDIPVQVGTMKVDDLRSVFKSVVIEGEREITVKRNGVLTKIKLPADFEQFALKNKIGELYTMRIPTVVNKPVENSNAEKAGVLAGDKIVAINGQDNKFTYELFTELEKQKGKQITVDVERNGEIQQLAVQVDQQGKIGIQLEDLKYFNIPYAIEKYSFFESIPAGAKHGVETLKSYVKSMKLVFSKEGAKQVGGFGSMSKIFSPTWDWKVFWEATAFLSVVLAFMNILPIPALDGGHVVFLLYEIITGKEAPQKVLEVAQYVGFILLITLMLYANGMDVIRAIFN